MENVGWGIGDQEMCVMLGFADSLLLYDGTVRSGGPIEPDGNIHRAKGECELIGIPKNEAQGPPTDAEKAALLYVPTSDLPADQVSPTLECKDADPNTAPEVEATLTAGVWSLTSVTVIAVAWADRGLVPSVKARVMS